MSDFYAKFVALKAVRDEIKRGGENEIYKRSTPEIRKAVDSEYFRALDYFLQMTKNDAA
jgi:hypothetical protein